METMKGVRERHQKEIEEFQENCPHEIISDWMQYYWAPGHYSHEVKICERCEKVMESNLPVWKIIKDEVKINEKK